VYPDPDIARRLEAIERKLDLLLNRFGIRDDENWLPEVLAFIQRGQKIQAIKTYRKATGAGLVEAKNAVEAMEAGRLPR
jgi:hypothetical protein